MAHQKKTKTKTGAKMKVNLKKLEKLTGIYLSGRTTVGNITVQQYSYLNCEKAWVHITSGSGANIDSRLAKSLADVAENFKNEAKI